MTREEIIQGLYRGDSKAIKEVIKILEREPDEDAISRADAVRVASGYCHPANIAKELAKLPPVQPKMRTGHWMWDCSIIPSTPVSPEEIDYCGWVCSECKQFPDDNDWDDPDEPPHHHYCPNCGCRMIEPQGSEKINCETTKCENCQNHNYCDFELHKSEG